MIRVRMKDLALVAFAGGLLAFELVSLGEALPLARKVLAEHGVLGKARTAAGVAHAGVASPALAVAPVARSHAAIAAAKGEARRLAEAPRAGTSERCLVVTRTASVSRAADGTRIVTVKGDGSCAAHVTVPSLERLREIESIVDQALKQASL